MRVDTVPARRLHIATMAKTPFPRLLAWLTANPDVEGLSHSTRFRYASGAVPSGLLWLLRNPDALEALAADARKLTAKQLAEIQGRIDERAAGQKQRRDAPAKPMGRKKR